MPRLSDAEKRSEAGLRRMIEYGIANGMSMGATDREFGMNERTISHACKKLGIVYPVHKAGRPPLHSDDDLRRMIRHGIDNNMSRHATAKKYGLNHHIIEHACKRLGIVYPEVSATNPMAAKAALLTRAEVAHMRSIMFEQEAADSVGISTHFMKKRFKELFPREHWLPSWPNGSKVIVMKNETRGQLQERVDGVNRLRATLESRLAEVPTPTPPGTCSVPASVTRPRCAPSGRGHLPVGSGWQVRECWDAGYTVEHTIFTLNIDGLNRSNFMSWIGSRPNGNIIIWRHRQLCQDMRRGLDWTKNHNV